tara:strand:+ start:563 stop:1264 length:702 start_codon:yes stop_codon:yes gene_type:complete
MYNTLYVNGASWLQGMGVEKNERFSYHLSKLMECSEKNVCQGGASNDWVMRTTMDYILNHRNIKNHYFVIGFSGYYRWDIWDDINQVFHKGHPTSFTHKQSFDNQVKEHGVDYAKHWKYYVEHFFSEELMREKFIRDIILFESFLQKQDVNYLLFDTTSGLLQTTQNIFDRFVDMSWEEFCGGNHSTTPFEHTEYISKIDGHPNKVNHKKWSNYLFDIIEEKSKIKEKVWPKY